MTSLHFENVEALWALAAALPLVFFFAWRTRDNRSSTGRWISVALRLFWVVLVLVALARPACWRTTSQSVPTHVLVLQDCSLSVQDDLARSKEQTQAILKSVPDGAKTDLLCFAGGVWSPPHDPVAPDQTDIEGALNAANLASLDAANSRIILLTDGRATKGNSVEAARRLALRGAGVYVMPLGRARPTWPRIVQIEPSTQARVGVSANFRISIQSTTPAQARVRLLDADHHEIDRCDVVIDGRETLLLRFTPKTPGLENYFVEVSTGEPPSSPAGSTSSRGSLADSEEVAVYVEGPPRVLLCDNFPEEVQTLKDALDGLHVPVDLIDPDHWPKSLGPYAAIVASDWSGKELTPDQRAQLRKFVEETGGGLVFIGGDNVLATNWQKNLLAEALPVVFREKPAQVVKKQPEVSVCFVLDRSGSMNEMLGRSAAGPVSKIEMVRASVLASIECLPEKSHVAVVVFDTKTDVIVDPVTIDHKDEIAKKIDMLQASGGTSMAPAVQKGLELLETMPGEKYLILLTDGLTMPPPGGTRFWDEQTAKAVKDRVSWVSIAVGTDADTRLMSKLANDTGGRYYYCDTASQIPQVFVKEARALRRLVAIKPTPFHAEAGPEVLRLKNLPVDEMPLLQGRVLSTAKRATDQILLAEGGEPLLTQWQFGLGKVACFTSDAKNAWAKDWVTWKKYSTFWTQVVESVLRPSQPCHVRVRSHSDGDKTIFIFQVLDPQGQPIDDLACEAKLFSAPGAAVAAGKVPAVPWRTPGPGEYEASVRLPDDGHRYLAVMSLRNKDGRGANYCAWVTAPHASEMSETGPDLVALKAIADAGQGICSDRIEDVVGGLAAAGRAEIRSQQPLWPWLIMAAILLWPLDLLVRKLG